MRRKQDATGSKRHAAEHLSALPLFDFQHGLRLERLLDLIPKTRTSNPVSKILRPIFEHKNLNKLLGTNLAALTLMTGATSIPVSALGVIPGNGLYANSIEVVVETNHSITYPLAKPLGVSQGFSVFHPGMDIRAPLGTEIYPVISGKVSLVARSKYGYGHYVEVTHSDGKVSLYAHMGKIYVEEGDEVTTASALGQVGMTGRTTGPHLHLEIMNQGKKINPMNVIAKK